MNSIYIYIRFSTISSLRYPLESWNVSPQIRGGILYLNVSKYIQNTYFLKLSITGYQLDSL